MKKSFCIFCKSENVRQIKDAHGHFMQCFGCNRVSWLNAPVLYLGDICARNHGGNECSKEANRVTSKSIDRKLIVEYLGTVTDATCDEVEIALEMNHQTCSARFSELKREGIIVPTVKRATRTGCKAQAWRLN
jgi:hypothetical protein